MQQTGNAANLELAAHVPDDGADAGAIPDFLEIHGTSGGARPDSRAPRFERDADLSGTATIVVGADGLTVEVEHGPGIRLTGILAIGSVDAFVP